MASSTNVSPSLELTVKEDLRIYNGSDLHIKPRHNARGNDKSAGDLIQERATVWHLLLSLLRADQSATTT